MARMRLHNHPNLATGHKFERIAPTCNKRKACLRGVSVVSSSRRVRKLISNPGIDAGFRHVERQPSSTKDFVMEGPDMEAGTKLLLCPTPDFEHFELTALSLSALD